MNSTFLPDDFEAQWTALCRRAAPNVFMSPAALQAVQVAEVPAAVAVL